MPVLNRDAGSRVLTSPALRREYPTRPSSNTPLKFCGGSVFGILVTKFPHAALGVLERGTFRRKAVPKHVYIFLKPNPFGGLIMCTGLATAAFQRCRALSDFLKSALLNAFLKKTLALATLLTVGAATALAQSPSESGGEASLKLPDLSSVSFLNGAIDGHRLLLIGILFCFYGLGFGMVIYMRLKNLPVHRSMREISELIYETCKTYLVTQGKFILLEHMEAMRVGIILLFSLVGIAGSYGVAWFGIRVNTFANSRTAFASLPGKPYPVYQIPLEAGMSIGMMLISVELLIMLFILLFIPGDYAGPCFIGFAIGESLGAAALRIAGGIFTKIADIGSDLMKIVFKIKEDDARNPGVIADCTGDNAGDSV